MRYLHGSSCLPVLSLAVFILSTSAQQFQSNRHPPFQSLTRQVSELLEDIQSQGGLVPFMQDMRNPNTPSSLSPIVRNFADAAAQDGIISQDLNEKLVRAAEGERSLPPERRQQLIGFVTVGTMIARFIFRLISRVLRNTFGVNDVFQAIPMIIQRLVAFIQRLIGQFTGLGANTGIGGLLNSAASSAAGIVPPPPPPPPSFSGIGQTVANTVTAATSGANTVLGNVATAATTGTGDIFVK